MSNPPMPGSNPTAFFVSAAGAPIALAIGYLFFWPDSDLLIRTNGAVRAYFGADFVNPWLGAKLAMEGQVHKLFDLPAYVAALRQAFVPDLAIHNWSYPPHLLLFVWPLGLMAYLPALAVWTAVTLGLFLLAAWPRADAAGEARDNWLLVAAMVVAPASIINVFGGQNGYLTAALFIGGWRLLPRHPVLAGVLFGCLTIKPHLGLLLPFALIALGAWRTIASAIVTTLVLVFASALIWGQGIWSGYLGPGATVQTQILLEMKGFFVAMMPTAYVSARLIGATSNAAALIQGLIAMAVIAVTVLAIRRTRDGALQLALMTSGTLCISPYILNYDMTAVSAALILYVASRAPPRAAMRYAIMLTMAVPALVMLANPFWVPVTPLITLAMFGLLAQECLARGRQAMDMSAGIE